MGQELCSSLKPLDITGNMHYIQYMKGEIMDYIKQIRMQRYMKTSAYRMELYNNALYACGDALY